jgi:hypothetical protein
MPATPQSPRRWPLVLLALAALFGAVFGLLGQFMAGSMSVATSWPPPAGHEAHWQRVGLMYQTILGVSSAVLLASLILLWRQRRRQSFI